MEDKVNFDKDHIVASDEFAAEKISSVAREQQQGEAHQLQHLSWRDTGGNQWPGVCSADFGQNGGDHDGQGEAEYSRPPGGARTWSASFSHGRGDRLPGLLSVVCWSKDFAARQVSTTLRVGASRSSNDGQIAMADTASDREHDS